MNSKYNWSLLVFALLSVCFSAHASDKRVEFLGNYSHVKSATGEHCDGYNVALWKYNGILIGYLNHHRGLCGDAPIGILEEVSYMPSTGNLLFKVKLSDGCSGFQDGRCVPTKDKITFKGQLNGQVLEGVLSWYSVDRNQQREIENVLLKNEGLKHQSFENYEKWIEYWAPILKHRGPKW